MDKESLYNQYQWEKGKFPFPSQILEAALSKIEEDGAVMLYDEEEENWFRWQPNESIALDRLPKDLYRVHLLGVARAIMSSCFDVAHYGKEVDYRLRSLAQYLTGYCHDRTFLEAAASLVKVDEKGGLYHPYLPLIR